MHQRILPTTPSLTRGLHAAALLAALIWPTFVLAAAADLASMASSKQMDANGDGKITAREHHTAARRMFEAMDADRDSRVTAAEMNAAQPQITGTGRASATTLSSADKIRAIDVDGDSVLTAAEHAVGAKAMFTLMDGNADGILNKRERAAGHAKLQR